MSLVQCVLTGRKKQMNFFQNVFTDFVGDFKYLIMLRCLMVRPILPLNGKQAKPFH
ncbi:hypothetical protein B1P85_06295 [Enterococcus faecalis]|nr:hypothetical protein B1P85_06295 [Enterococcus faecalis]